MELHLAALSAIGVMAVVAGIYVACTVAMDRYGPGFVLVLLGFIWFIALTLTFAVTG